MLTTDVPSSIQNFWVPVSQIVPVFALALVIEGRAIARKWTATAHSTRRFEAAAMIIAGIILWTVESTAIQVMISEESSRAAVNLAAFGLFLVIPAMSLSPMLTLAGIANVDLLFVLNRVRPKSKWWAARRQVKELEVAINETIASALRTVEVSEDFVDMATKTVELVKDQAESRARARAALDAFDELSDDRRSKFGPDELLDVGRLRELTADGDGIAEVERAVSDLARAKRKLSARMKYLIPLAAKLDKLEEWKETVRLRNFSEAEILGIEFALAHYKGFEDQVEIEERLSALGVTILSASGPLKDPETL